MQGEQDQKAVAVLLKEPAVTYLRELRRTIDRDPHYLAYFKQSVGIRIQTLLAHEGIYWDDEVFDKVFLKLVTEAIERLREREK